LSTSQITNLDMPIIDDEIQKVLFFLKAPSPDGFSIWFFKKAWSIVGIDTICVICSFFNSIRLLKEVNATTITLIPKVPNPFMIKEFGPISYCNTTTNVLPKLVLIELKRCSQI